MLELKFTKSALIDWGELDPAIRARFKKRLQRFRLLVSSRSRLKGFGGMLFKIKITSPQFRLVYRIDEKQNQLIVIAVGPRDSIYTKLTNER
jgi:mRNA interferase RelE/StbE